MWLPLILCLLVGLGLHAEAPLVLRIDGMTGTPRLESSRHVGRVLRLERSADLHQWSEAARVFDQLLPYRTPEVSPNTPAFYRVVGYPLSDTDDWANQVDARSEHLFQPGNGTQSAVAVAKWTLLLAEPDRIRFQDTVRYPFHIQFARARLPGYAGIGALEFTARSLRTGPGQQLVVGSLLRAPDPQIRELGIEVTGLDTFPGEHVANWVRTVRDRVHLPPGWRIFYLPSTGQEAEAEAHRDRFAEAGTPVDSLNRWIRRDVCYSSGWALGRLVTVPSAEIPAALADGRLGLTDILVTDRVPAELPVLAGFVSLSPATPNSHVALLARSLLIPFAHAAGAGLQAELASLQGREVLLVVEETPEGCRIGLTDTTDLLGEERRREILESKRSGILDIPPTSPRGRLTLPVDPATPDDIRYIGGKAAHFGFLRRAVPEASPAPVLAITFDLWNAYLSQGLATGGTLREFIATRLTAHVYPPDIPALRADLAAIRDTIENGTDFTPAQRSEVLQALLDAGLSGRKIRFRSSTNVEDGDTFNGAGLYDSFSGCLEDDLDADTTGPSRCDPSEARERGVFRALRKVYASFYNENAVLERLRHSVDESGVGMAVLVHFSVPDPLEMANGVATLAVTRAGDTRSASARIVTQVGAESVTNPDGNIRPEVVEAAYTGTGAAGPALTLVEPSSLRPDSEPVMTWQTDYHALVRLMDRVAVAWEEAYPTRTAYELDFEFKRIVPGEIQLKQVRPVPHPVPVPVPTLP